MLKGESDGREQMPRRLHQHYESITGRAYKAPLLQSCDICGICMQELINWAPATCTLEATPTVLQSQE